MYKIDDLGWIILLFSIEETAMVIFKNYRGHSRNKFFFYFFLAKIFLKE